MKRLLHQSLVLQDEDEMEETLNKKLVKCARCLIRRVVQPDDVFNNCWNVDESIMYNDSDSDLTFDDESATFHDCVKCGLFCCSLCADNEVNAQRYPNLHTIERCDRCERVWCFNCAPRMNTEGVCIACDKPRLEKCKK